MTASATVERREEGGFEPRDILVVEDERIVALDLKHRLRLLGYGVPAIASSALEAVSATERTRPDLVLMDIRLKGSTGGIEAAREIRRRFDIPVVYLTAYSDAETLTQAKQTAPFGYLIKPCEDTELRSAIEVALYKHHMERELRDSEARHRSLTDDVLDTSRVAIAILDPRFRVIWVNRSLACYFGLERDEIIGRDNRELVTTRLKHIFKDPDDFSRRVLATYEDNTYIESFECAVVPSADRPARWLAHWSQPIRSGLYAGGRIEHYYDVTDRKVAEEALRSREEELLQARKMEAVGRLAGGVAHDFNNLLMAILGYSDLLLQRLRAEDPVRTEIGVIKTTAERAASLTQQLLAFSRRQILQPRIVDINDVVGDMQQMLPRVLGEDVDLVVQPEARLNLVKADPGQIQQVILNLALNARDAMPSGGRLIIETANVFLNETDSRRSAELAPGWHVLLGVRDTGTGMDAETLSHIFEPFFTTKELGRGTGLGLSTVYGIVMQSGGSISVKSRPGSGTSFEVFLPRADGVPEPQPASAPNEELPRGTETILLVEDDQSVRGLALELLTGLGYNVLPASRGNEALVAAQAHHGPIHLLITDVVMPGRNGRELAQQLRAVVPDLRILFISGYTDNVIAHHGLLEQGVNFMQKPFSLAALARTVRTLLDG